MLWNSQAISTNGEMYNNRVSDRQNVLVFVSYQHYCLTPNNCTASCFAMIQLSQDWLGKPKIYITLNCRCCYTGNNEVQLLLTVVGLMKKKTQNNTLKKHGKVLVPQYPGKTLNCSIFPTSSIQGTCESFISPTQRTTPSPSQITTDQFFPKWYLLRATNSNNLRP